jgi:sporulation protein YlmC with PRC-barrel domain
MILTRKLQGRKVISRDAKTVGEVSGTYVDVNNWKITNLLIDLSDQTIELFGYKKPTPIIGSVSACLPISAVKVVGDVITLNTTFSELPSLSMKQM